VQPVEAARNDGVTKTLELALIASASRCRQPRLALRTVLALGSPHSVCRRCVLNERPLKILIIDENAIRAAILEEGLREAGAAAADPGSNAYAVHHIRDTVDLLPRIAAVDPDVILIDLENPSRDTLEQMFQVSRLAKRPIAMFVDRSEADATQAAIDAGVSAYIVDGLRKERVKSILDVTISRFHAFDRLQSELTEAKSALEERKIVDQAKAILMKRNRLSEEQAYVLLRRTAMNQNRKIADLARALVTASSLLTESKPEK
jgi:two-component system, response regulator / RNA-binding antiterminator